MSQFYAIADKQPQCIGKGHFIAPTAAIIGDVVLHENSSVWFNVVIRAENDRVTIGKNSNIQDLSMLHVDPGFPLTIADNVTVGHKAMLHGCTIGEGSLIGMNAVLLNGAVIGKGCVIAANALVTEGMVVPDGSMVMGAPGKIKKQLDQASRDRLQLGASNYVANAQYFNDSLRPVAKEDVESKT